MRLFAPIITGSLNVTGSVSITGSVGVTSAANDIFFIKNVAGNNVLTVSQSGVIIVATQSVELTNPAPNGGIYFTSSSFFVGLD
jgi:hypothetical protein